MKFLNFPVLTPLAADPGTPAAGTIYVNTTAGLKWFNTSWSTAMDLESAQTASGTKTFNTINVTTLALTNALTQAKTHASPDTDTATTALHHTLGTGANQAAAGNHTHDAAGIATGTLAIARGGTNSTAVPTAGTVAYGAGTAFGFTAAGQQNQVLISNVAAAPSWATLDLTYLPDAWVKKAVRVASTVNLALSGTQTIDAIAVVAGDRVLVKDQTTPSQNGIYVVAAGAWTRALDADTASEIAGAMVNIDLGASQGGQRWTCSFRSTDTLGTSNVNWYRNVDGSMGGAAFGYATLDSAGDVPIAQLPVATSGTSSPTLIVRADDSRLSDARLPSNDADLVHISGTETITGSKTFSSPSTFQRFASLQDSTGGTPAFIKARVTANGGQLADLLQVWNESSQTVFKITSAGDVDLNGGILTSYGLVAGKANGSSSYVKLEKANVTTSGTTTTDSTPLRLVTGRWTGAADASETVDVRMRRRSATLGDQYLDIPVDVSVTGALSTTGNGTVGGTLTVTGTLDAPNVTGAWTTYAMTWTAATTNPTIGNGTITAEYKQIGKTVFVRALIQRGSTTTAGSGAYIFSLPVASTFPGAIGSAMFSCAGTAYGATAGLVTSSAFGIYNGSTRIASATPGAWNATDYISVALCYKVP